MNLSNNARIFLQHPVLELQTRSEGNLSNLQHPKPAKTKEKERAHTLPNAKRGQHGGPCAGSFGPLTFMTDRSKSARGSVVQLTAGLDEPSIQK